MMKIRLAIAVLVTVGLAGAPFAAEAKKHQRIRHTISTVQSATYGSAGMPTTQSYGTSGLWDIRLMGHPEFLLEQ
jgi:hypothetical protein